ncbi:MAG: hypothetical protein J6L03_03315 [Bacteroidaceae bacterium]|nr:hypothetical protein [Bacteroidaceae bacterium]
MKSLFIQSIALLSLLLALVACEGTGPGDSPFKPQNYTVSGKVEKGPFVSGSTITMQLLDSEMQPLGSMFNTTILDDEGSFTFGSKQFDTPYADLSANGYFFNEVRGELSAGTLNLRAIVDISDASTINVNILTHIKYQRVLNLVASGKSFKEANQQAQKELFEAFGCLQFADVDASRFSIIGGDDKAGALIAISSLLLVERSEAELTEYLARLCREFATDGKFSAATQEIIREDLNELSYRLEDISRHIVSRYADLGITVEVPDLRKYLDWDGDGIPGNEEISTPEVVVPENTIANLYHESEVNANGVPLLGSDGSAIVASMAVDLAKSISTFNLVQQYYHYNTTIGNLVSQYIYPSNSLISDCWQAIYKSQRTGLLIQYADAMSNNVYQEYSHFFTALRYYYMTAMWGDVPYITNYEWYSSGQWQIERTDMRMILDEQAHLLREGMEGLFEEKRNESLKDINSFFFVSKDAARVLLAEMALTMGDYHMACEMLQWVMNSGFYELTTANFSDPDTFNGNTTVADSDVSGSDYHKELIFALDCSSGITTRTGVTIQVPPVIPVQTLTEVMLLYAEACYQMGDRARGEEALRQLAQVKGITINTDDMLQGITDARKQLLLYSVGNFAYMKRNNLFMQEYGVDEHYMLLPIPQQEVDLNPLMLQNPGY